ncbi:PP125 [Orf virus]|nr:PP125 [Orf virus]
MEEELTHLIAQAMEMDLSVAHISRLRRLLTKLRVNTFTAVACMREAIARKSWLPPGRMLGTDINEDMTVLEYMVQEVDNARENIEPYLCVIQWAHNTDVLDDCLREAMDEMYGECVLRIGRGVVECRFPHLVADRCYSCLSALFSEDACVRFTNELMRQSRTMARCIVDRAHEPGGSYDELVDMVRHQNVSKVRLWPRVVANVVEDVIAADLEGLMAYCRTCLMSARVASGGLIDLIKDRMGPLIVECIETHVAEGNLDRALCLYVNYVAVLKTHGLHARALEKLSGKTLYGAVVAAPPCDTDMLLSYIERLPREELAAFARVAFARIVKSVYTGVNLEKHISLKLAMELYPPMASSALNDLVRRLMSGRLLLPLLPPPQPMEHDGEESGHHDPEMVLMPVNVYTVPTPVPLAAMTPPESLRGAVESALARADTAYDVAPLAAFGRAELTIPAAAGREQEVICSSAHLVCIVLMDEAGKTGVTVEDAARHLGNDARLAEMTLTSLCKEKIAKRRTVDGMKRFALNPRLEARDSPMVVFN